jgi:hypothetical protein
VCWLPYKILKHSKYTDCQKATGAKESSDIWLMSSNWKNYDRTSKNKKAFKKIKLKDFLKHNGPLTYLT